MSTSFLYHTSGLIGYQYQKTEYKDGKVFVYVQKLNNCSLGRLTKCPPALFLNFQKALNSIC
ncbi:hypothetical protein IH824_15390 [candidate division KSB1 bacterium]|nr:hypothetical protein [candidate division KSB1 bacterium]